MWMERSMRAGGRYKNSSMADFDVTITGGTIIDGSGKPGFRGDVGIRGGRVAALGNAIGTTAKTVDAEGHVVCPGFVDIHTHYDDLSKACLQLSSITTAPNVVWACAVGRGMCRAAPSPETIHRVVGMAIPIAMPL